MQLLNVFKWKASISAQGFSCLSANVSASFCVYVKISSWLWILFYLFDCFLLITCQSQTCKHQKLDRSYLCKIPTDNNARSQHTIRPVPGPPTRLTFGSYSAISKNMLFCCAVWVSYLNNEHLTRYWKQEVIFPKKMNPQKDQSVSSPLFKMKKIFGVVASKCQKKLFLSQAYQICFSSVCSQPGPHWMVNRALLRWLQCPHCIPRLILLLTRPVAEARKETWTLMVVQTSHSEELHHEHSPATAILIHRVAPSLVS